MFLNLHPSEVFGFRNVVEALLDAAKSGRRGRRTGQRGCCLFGIASSGKTLVGSTVCRRSGLPYSVIDCALVGDEASFMDGLIPLLVGDEDADDGGGVLVLDGLDGLLTSQWAEDPMERCLQDAVLDRISQLLACPSRFVFVIVTARSPETLHPQIWDTLFPWRFTLGALDQAAREDMLRAFAPHLGPVEIRSVAERLTGFTGGDVRHLFVEARLSAIDPLHVSAAELMACNVRPASLSLQQLTVDTHLSFQSVAGLEEQKRMLKGALETGMGAVLCGPSGSGKTHLALAVCGEMRVAVLSIRGVDVISAVVGKSEKGLVDVFDRARSAAPCVMLLDQLESLAPRRQGTVTLSSTQARLLSCLVSEMDKCVGSGVHIIATVSQPSLCDESVFGAGRLECKVELPGPSVEYGLEVLRHRLKSMRVAPNVDEAALCGLAQRFCGSLSAASVCANCEEAALVAMRESLDAKHVELRHLEIAFAD